jgi:hypothetical protein
MTITELRKRAKESLDSLPAEKVRVAAEFLGYLETAASRDATAELLEIPGLLKDVREASKHVRGRKYKGWREVRDDV